MINSALKPKVKSGSTQKFTEVQDIKEDIVILEGGYASLIIEIQAVNFDLLSQDEKAARIFSYASLLNSLSYPIQIIIRNKKIDIGSYLKLLETEEIKAKDTEMAKLIKSYQEFVGELIKINTVLDKKFYISLSFSGLELGVGSVVKKGDFFLEAKASLHTRAESLLEQLGRLSLRAKILDKESLVKLFYDIYNQESEDYQGAEAIKTPVVTSGQKI